MVAISIVVLSLLILQVTQATQAAAQTSRSDDMESADLPIVSVIFRINGSEAAGYIYCNNTKVLKLDIEYKFLNGTALSCKYSTNEGYTFDSWSISNKVIKMKTVVFAVLKDEILTAQFQDRRDPFMFMSDLLRTYSFSVIGVVLSLPVSYLVTHYQRKKRKEHKETFDLYMKAIRDTDTIREYQERKKSIKETEGWITQQFKLGFLSESQYEKLYSSILQDSSRIPERRDSVPPGEQTKLF